MMNNPLSEQTLSFVREHAHDDVCQLALQAAKYPLVDMPMALNQISGRQIAIHKIPSWAKHENILYPPHLSMEQCSSEMTARYKAGLMEGSSFADLTGGFGIDCSFLAERFKQADYVERQGLLCEIARHNFQALGLEHIRVHHENGIDYLQRMNPIDCLFLDPARRDKDGRKTVLLADCEPNIIELENLLVDKAQKVLIKLSPMLDISSAIRELHYIQAIHVISTNNECKELLLELGESTETSLPVYCLNFTANETQRFTFDYTSENLIDCSFTDMVGEYLYEPNASILKAGGFRSIAQAYPVKKLHPNSHLYTSNAPVSSFPGRSFKVDQTSCFRSKELKLILGNQKKANITVRNFPASVAELRKRTKLKEGGEVYLFATTLANEQKVCICCHKI